MVPSVCCFKFSTFQSESGYNVLARLFKAEADLPERGKKERKKKISINLDLGRRGRDK